MAAPSATSRRGNLMQKLASPSAKSKGKIRRRGRLFQEVILKQIRLLVLFALAIFVIAIFKVGLPGALQPTLRLITPTIGFNLSESQVDIKMNELYDAIEFKDLDGGAWKQGWNVQYTGNEWDKHKLRVFVVPHSHNDPGWLRTVEEYYQERSRRILSTIVQALKKDKERKFIWEEMSYLERWWRDASEAEKRDFLTLVKNGQLEIVGGGWVMNDEANSHYYAIIEQITEGNLWLKDTVGVVPRNAWAIDPFGHSPTMAYLLRRMGFDNMLIQRTHYEVKKILAQKQNLEFIWRQSWDNFNTTDIFCHMMPFYSYDIPHTCGPEPAICCQFDFWRLPGFGSALRCPWRYDPQQITIENVQERSETLLDQYRKKATLYKTNTLLVPLGDDFRYITIAEADLQFENYQKIFNYINTHPKLKAEVQFGTLQDYFTAVKDEIDARKGKVKVPSLSGDFFTYADRVQDYWSGYYVSRPFYKSVDRILEETLRAADVLSSLSLAYCQAMGQGHFPLSISEKLTAARRTLALFQHHDGITGTAKNHVVVDYARKMHSALLDLQEFMAKGVGVLLGRDGSQGMCRDADLDIFIPEKEQRSHDVLPVRRLADVVSDHVQRLVIYNPLEEEVKQVVMVLVERTDVCVLGADWEPIVSQVSPEWGNTREMATGKHRLHWQVQVPPLGLQTFFISTSEASHSCKAAEVAQIEVFHATDSFSCPSPYKCTHTAEKVEIQSQHITLAFSVQDGLLQGWKNQRTSMEASLQEDIAFYSSRGSGAYLFKPLGEASSMVSPGGLIIVTKGSLMQEVLSHPKSIWSPSPASRRARVYNGVDTVQGYIAEMVYHVELLDNVYNDKELIVRFKTDLDTGNTFFTDLNGFQTVSRETREKIPLQGNYYPMPSLAFLQEPKGRRFSIHSRQALGVASLKSGALEVMLDRRLTRDDDRGLGQGVLDNRPMDVTFHLLLEGNISSLPRIAASTPRVPSLLSHLVLSQLSYPMHTFFAKAENVTDAHRSRLQKTFAPLAMKFPCDLHIVSMKVAKPLDDLSSRATKKASYALTLQRRGWDHSYCRRGQMQCSRFSDKPISLSDVFGELQISTSVLSSLNLLHDASKDIGQVEPSGRKQGGGFRESKGLISMAPMEIQSMKLDLSLDKESLSLQAG
ncbi:hypothetical protein GOP47_0013619 [Adiantum capillus-veneris]|uniref:Alpha-mannosidase n=1 Tax=Adiantum capillus-veneris TaxID=13818 RepID=A0A9D4UNV5_ADICA|nr:hypothetical protein GOP47_0013619 [Adiantum capillus-veneris]